MNITERIINYQNDQNRKKSSSIFLDLANDIIKDFPHHLNKKTYLLIPDSNEELRKASKLYSLSNGKPMDIRATLILSQINNKFNEVAKKLGFTVITSMDEYHNDGELLDLLGIESINEKTTINSPDVNIPLTLSVDEYLKRIFFPVVFKNNTTDRGEDKYLIENMEQLKKIITLFELPQNERFNFKKEFVVQEYIKGFDDFNTSVRVVTTCTGDILYSLFLVSTEKEAKKRVKEYGIGIFNPCEQLTDPNSEYYLNSRNITSNYASGGKVIPLNPLISNFTASEEIVLSLHGIDSDTFELPEAIVKQCRIIANQLGTKKGIVTGMDFIYNSSNNNWYFLEANRNPSIDGYKLFMNLNGYQKKDVQTLMYLDALTKIVENIMTRDLKEEIKRSK